MSPWGSSSAASAVPELASIAADPTRPAAASARSAARRVDGSGRRHRLGQRAVAVERVQVVAHADPFTKPVRWMAARRLGGGERRVRRRRRGQLAEQIADPGGVAGLDRHDRGHGRERRAWSGWRPGRRTRRRRGPRASARPRPNVSASVTASPKSKAGAGCARGAERLAQEGDVLALLPADDAGVLGQLAREVGVQQRLRVQGRLHLLELRARSSGSRRRRPSSPIRARARRCPPPGFPRRPGSRRTAPPAGLPCAAPSLSALAPIRIPRSFLSLKAQNTKRFDDTHTFPKWKQLTYARIAKWRPRAIT